MNRGLWPSEHCAELGLVNLFTRICTWSTLDGPAQASVGSGVGDSSVVGALVGLGLGWVDGTGVAVGPDVMVGRGVGAGVGDAVGAATPI